jgi:hypothetical protein
MAYRYPGGENKAAIELYPVSNKKSVAAAQAGAVADARTQRRRCNRLSSASFHPINDS